MRVSNYKIFLFHRDVNYGSYGSCWTLAQVRLSGTNGREPLLIFYDPAKTPKVPKDAGGSGNPFIFIPMDQYPWHIDLLRHESPIDLQDDDKQWTFGSLRTAGSEPVGEGE